MDDKELIAAKLGFSSAEEMEAYHDLCRGDFKEGIVMTKEICAKHIDGSGFENLLTAPREERLEKKLFFDFGGLVESAKAGDSESVTKLKSLIDFELSELDKCCAIEDHKTMK